MTGLSIGKAIFKNLDSILKGKVFPLIADQGTEFPFIVYRRNSITPAATKDRMIYKDDTQLEIIVASSTYAGGIEIAEQVRAKLENLRGNFNGIQINDTELISADESFSEDAFIQKLIFSFEIA